jgi:orotate phosphoribosyltransferase
VVRSEERVEGELFRSDRDGEQVVVARALLGFGEDSKDHGSSLQAVASDALIEHLRTHSVRTGDFVLKNGKHSSWFIDSKQSVCRPDGVVLVAEAALEVIPAEATAIGGLTHGADPVAYSIAAIGATRGRQLRSFSIRREAKDHGVMGRIAGPLLPGDKVVVTEDTATRGTSALEAAKVIRDLGADPIMILVVVDRGGTGAELAAAEGIAFHALVTAPDLGFDYESGA